MPVLDSVTPRVFTLAVVAAGPSPAALTARTWKPYCEPASSPVTTWEVVNSSLGEMFRQLPNCALSLRCRYWYF